MLLLLILVNYFN